MTALLLAGLLMGGPKPVPTCDWSAVIDGSATLTLTNLPDEYAITWQPYPTGVAPGPSELSMTVRVTEPLTAYVIQRGGGPTLIKLGRQLNDYRVTAYCSVEVAP